ncbi:MAG: isoleucine--tRNA ligase, partial [Rikenellaceae bacterium]|nr:isoleucine--tRNA ligase [Rikenellaceae bacterium]
LGPRYGKYMKQIAALVATFDQQRIAEIESSEKLMLEVAGEQLEVTREDFEITSEDMPGWLVASEGKLTVALDITVTDELRREGVARELINRIQNLRKDSGLEVTDKIAVEVEALDELSESLAEFGDYVTQQVLAVEIKVVAEPAGEFATTTDLDEKPLRIALSRR